MKRLKFRDLKVKVSGQPGSRNRLPEELIKKSTLFRKDMRKLNIMNDVKDFLENRVRISKELPSISPKAAVNATPGGFKFPF